MLKFIDKTSLLTVFLTSGVNTAVVLVAWSVEAPGLQGRLSLP